MNPEAYVVFVQPDAEVHGPRDVGPGLAYEALHGAAGSQAEAQPPEGDALHPAYIGVGEL